MIKFVTGKPRAGKSLRAVALILECLMQTDKVVVTNLPLHLDEIQEYLLKRGREVNVYQRVILLRKEEIGDIKESQYKEILKAFFLYRNLDYVPCPKPDNGDELDFPRETFGRLFVIDEIHKLWPAREFAKCDKLIFEYLAEHAHFSDDVIFCTQALAQVDKQIRLLAQDFEVIRNRAKEKYSIFRGPEKFTRFVFLTAPTGGNQQTPSEKTSFTLDLEQASCYSTSAKGGTADIGQKAKGLPMWVLWGSIAAGVAAVWALLTLLPGAFATAYAPAVAGQLRDAPQQVAGAPLVQAVVSGSKLVQGESVSLDKAAPVIVGWFGSVASGGMAWLSDGRRINLGNVLWRPTDRGLWIAGQEFSLASPPLSNSPPP